MFEQLGGPAITLSYYLFKLFCIQAALFIAWGQWQRHTSFRARRLTFTFGNLMLLHVLLLFFIFISSEARPLGAPFERVVAVAGLGLLLWGFTPFFREQESFGLVLLSGNTVLAFLAYLATLVFWHGSDFNYSYWEAFFVLWQVALVLFGLGNGVTKLNDERLYVIFSFGILLVGYIAHGLLMGNYPQPNVPLFVRLAEIIAYILLTVAIYQGAMQSLAARTQEYENLSEISLDQIKGLISLFEATQQISQSLDVAKVLDGATKSIALALEADQCAIAISDDDMDTSQLRLVSIYNLSRKGRGEAVSFPSNDQPAIKHVLKTKQEIQVDEYADDKPLQFLFILMGAQEAGPLLVQPLIRDNQAFGVLLLGNAVSKRVFKNAEMELSRSLADQVSVAIRHAKEYAAVSAKAQQLSWTLRNQELEAGKRRAAMETELKKSREEVSLFSQRLYDYEVTQRENETALQQAREKIVKLEKTVERARVEVEKSGRKDKQITTLTTDLEQYKQAAQTLEEQQQLLQQKVEQSLQDATEVDRLNELLKVTNRRARKLARALKQARSEARQITALPTSLSMAMNNQEFDALSCGVIVADVNHKINRANQAALLLLNQNGQLIGQDLAAISIDKRWQHVIKQLQAQSGTIMSTQFQVDKNILRATLSPLALADNHQIEGTITLLYDITMEVDSLQARDEFVASLSQDLRTPMTAVIGYTDLMLSESVGPIGLMQRKFLQRVKANIERMYNLLNDLIGVTTLDAGQLELHPAAIDLTEVIEDIIISARTQMEEKNLIMEQNLLDEMPLIEVDPDSIHQIMTNLLNNAIKATAKGKTISLTTSFYQDPAHQDNPDRFASFLKISLRDSGGGIANKDLPRVFDRFYRANTPLIQGLGETGVGLAIAKSLVEANGGQIWVESEIGVGTTFSFTVTLSYQPEDPWSSFLGTLPPLDLSSD